MHRAGVDGAFRHRFRLAPAQIFLRICDEFGAAAGGTEIVGVAAMVSAVPGFVWVDRHAAHRVDRAACSRMVVMSCRHACTLPLIPPGGI